ncbi:hypothetical protein V5O48_008891, partial [Marasmius crinis-equi]
MATAVHPHSPFQSTPSPQSYPFPTSPNSHSPFQLRPISPHPHYPYLPPHPQPSSERRVKHEVERERSTYDRRDERADSLMKDERERGFADRGDKRASRELQLRERRNEQFVNEKEPRERIESERRDGYPREEKLDERDRDSRRPLSPSSLK